MIKVDYIRLVKYLCLIALVSSCNNNDVPPPEKPVSQKILEITEVKIAVLESKPLQLSITAKGNVSSSGWSKPVLVPFIYVVPPQDGVYDFDFIAVTPEDVGASVITPIEINYRLNPLPAGLKGVRIHATNNNKLAILDFM